MNIIEIKKTATQLARDRRGAAIVEYLIIVGLVALVCFAAYKIFGKAVDTKIKDQTTKVRGI